MLTLTKEIAFAAAQDAGNRHMRQHGRTSWNEDDYDVACDEYNRLWPDPLAPTSPAPDSPSA